MKRFMLVLLTLGFTVSLAAAKIPAGFSKVQEMGGITEYRLDENGLTVLLMEEHSAPVLTFMVTYRVGSRNEVTGTTGSTHLLEHLMFKGTEKYNKDNGNHIDALLGNIGARLNATTWLDRTNYYESIPSEYLELAVDVEADRMRNLLLKKEDKEAEMTVVRNEFERGENSPYSALSKAITAAAIVAHPYHHSTIGWRSDIENVPMPKLRDFYNTYYWPNNATVTVIGDFKTDEALALVKKYYGEIPKSPEPIPEVYTVEPEQEGPRRVIVKRAGQLGAVGIAYKVPEGQHQDSYALDVLDVILEDGKNSRYYKGLIDKNLAVNAFNSYFQFKDPSLFTAYAFLTPGTAHEQGEEAILAELEKVKSEGVTEDEVKRAINQIAASTAYGRDGSFSIASQLNEAIAMGDWTFFVTYLENIRKVTAADVQRVAQTYLLEDQSTTGYFIPRSSGGEQGVASSEQRSGEESGVHYYRQPTEALGSLNATPLPMPQSESKIADNITRKSIEGIDVITAKMGIDNVVTFQGSMAAGDVFSSGNSMIADLTGRMLDKGTQKNDKFALSEKLENMGASINFSVDKHNLEFSGRCLAGDVTEVVELIAEQMRYPAFDAEELEKLKKQREGDLKQLLDDTNTMAREKMAQLMFDQGHPNYEVAVSKLIEDLKTVTVDDLKKFHATYYGPESMIFVAAGDVDTEKIHNAFRHHFASWTGGIEHTEFARELEKPEGGMHVVTMEDKTSATLMLGQNTALTRTDSDYLAFTLGNRVLGGGGFTARLMSIIRDEEGLTYGIYSSHSGDVYADGYWFITGTFSPQLLDKGINSTMREFTRWVDEGVTKEELDNMKSRLSGSYKVQLATTRGMAAQILSFVERGYDVTYMDQYTKDLQAVTLDEVNAAIKKYIDPEKVLTVIAGSVDEDGKPLSKKD